MRHNPGQAAHSALPSPNLTPHANLCERTRQPGDVSDSDPEVVSVFLDPAMHLWHCGVALDSERPNGDSQAIAFGEEDHLQPQTVHPLRLDEQVWTGAPFLAAATKAGGGPRLCGSLIWSSGDSRSSPMVRNVPTGVCTGRNSAGV